MGYLEVFGNGSCVAAFWSRGGDSFCQCLDGELMGVESFDFLCADGVCVIVTKQYVPR